MARRSASRPAPSRQQTRQASTHAAPAQPVQQQQYAQPQVVQQKQPGLFAQMASTAAGVAVGSAVGHTIGAGLTGMFSGSSSEQQPAQQQQYNMEPVQQTQQQTQQGACDVTARSFTRCLEENNGNMTICDYYLQQLKACQEASKQY